MNIGLDLVWFILKLISSVPMMVYGLFTKSHESEVYEFMRESGLDNVFDFFSGGFLCFMGFIHYQGINYDLHSICQALFFYIGGFSATIWALFRLKLAYLDHKLKSEQLEAIKKDNQLKDVMIKDFEKGMGEVNDLKKHLKK